MPPDTGKDPLSDLKNDVPFSDSDIGTSTSGDTSGDGGSAVGGVGHSVTARTSADVSGVNSPAVSAGAGRGAAPAAGGMMGGGMGGGGMMGAGGAGAGAGGKGKERPDIKSSDPAQHGKDSLDEAIEGGLLGRSTSKKPE